MAKYCGNCGHEVDENAYVCVKCGYKLDNGAKASRADAGKSRVVAGILGILLGAFGVHNFYLGYNNKAMVQLLLTVLTCGALSFISAIWGLIEGILILVGNINQDASGKELVD